MSKTLNDTYQCRCAALWECLVSTLYAGIWKSPMCLCLIIPEATFERWGRGWAASLVKYSDTKYLKRTQSRCLMQPGEVFWLSFVPKVKNPKGITSFSLVNSFSVGTAGKFHLDSVSNSSHIMLCQFICMRGNNRNLNTMVIVIPMGNNYWAPQKMVEFFKALHFRIKTFPL